MPRHKELPGSADSQLLAAKQWIEDRKFVKAKELLAEFLLDDFLNPAALFLWANVERELLNYGIAANLYRRVIDILEQTGGGDSAIASAWGNLGYTLHQLWLIDLSIEASQKAIELDPSQSNAYVNVAAAYLAKARPDKTVEYARKALEISPDSEAAIDNLGVGQLFLEDWAEGWENYEISLGRKYRKEWVYGNEPRWDGAPDQNLIIYGEQGLGDELLFASCIRDAITDSQRVVIDCDKRLEGLFRRSFPNAAVYGTRNETENVFWEVDIPRVDARVSMGTLPKYYRLKNEDFPGTPYLIADPERRVQWRALFDQLGPEPKIGIAWTGGTRATGRRDRCLAFDELEALCAGLPVHWISLEYLEPDPRIAQIPIHHWKRGTDTEDYDDTAALVAELDLVITVPTTVTHVAGGLGKETWCLVPKYPNWRFSLSGDRNLWHSSVSHIRQLEPESWMDVVTSVRQLLIERFEINACIHRDGRETANSGNGADVEHHSPPVRDYTISPIVPRAYWPPT